MYVSLWLKSQMEAGIVVTSL